jgi:putative membrane protein
VSSFRLTHVLRGVAIGSVEVVPGVSGGTVALVVGVYERLISAASHLVSAARATADVPRGLGWARARAEVARVEWPLVLAVLSGMVLAVLVAARVLPPLIEAHPVGTSALFFGMVAASVAVPLLDLGGRPGVREWGLVVLGAVGTALVTGLPPGDLERPSLWLVAPAAALAVCALVLPGLSGSFLLLAMGLYEPTLRAVDERDLAYVGTFLLGAVLGLAFFVKGLEWVLEHHRRTVLALMTGILIGALRALWPWQTADRGLLAPDAGWPAMLGVAVLGAGAVGALVVVQLRTQPSVGARHRAT